MNATRKYDILANYNDCELPISRNNAEEIRNDPFALGINVKGLANVNHQRNLSNYAEELVAHYAKYECEQYLLSLHDLPESEQKELTRLYMESTDRETGECVHGNDFSINNEYTCALLFMLQDDSQENRNKFAEVTRKNIISYYKLSLQEILDSACSQYLQNMMNEQGFYSYRDQEHGDIVWGKF
jgi:hypothetical protein